MNIPKAVRIKSLSELKPGKYIRIFTHPTGNSSVVDIVSIDSTNVNSRSYYGQRYAYLSINVNTYIPGGDLPRSFINNWAVADLLCIQPMYMKQIVGGLFIYSDELKEYVLGGFAPNTDTCYDASVRAKLHSFLQRFTLSKVEIDAFGLELEKCNSLKVTGISTELLERDLDGDAAMDCIKDVFEFV